MRVIVSAGLTTVLMATLMAPVASAAAYTAPTPQTDFVTPSHLVYPSDAVGKTAKRTAGAAPVWPAAGTTEVAMAGAAKTVPGTPITLAGLPGRAQVRMHDRAATATAGVKGLLFEVNRADALVSAETKVTVDYRAFAGAFGGDWAARLRLVQLPQCALTTPDLPQCRGTALPTDNDVEAGTLSADVAIGSNAILAAESGPSGGSGDFAASSLSPSATWSAGSSTGEFNWSYSLRTPPGVGGMAPKLALSYSSASVDGRMAASNNQPSMLGEGFDLSTGYIERRYLPCNSDKAPGGNQPANMGDLCWMTDNATLSMAGHAGELLKDPSTPDRWHLRGEDGSFIRHRTGAGNGDDNGEWWIVTATDGTEYWFGGKAASNSTLTAPVAGNHTGEPCNSGTYANSFCTQAWRWNLDHVIDVHGNTMTYRYTKETNKYAKRSQYASPVDYDRAAFLTRIEYGTRTDSTGQAPVVVDFSAVDRCVTSSCGTHDKLNYPDTPYDLECTGNPCYIGTPTFWTTRRWGSVTTKLWTGTADLYTPVTTWTFTHSFRDPGDGTRAGLILERIAQTGQVRVTTTMPDVVFDYVQKHNRVDPLLTGDHSPAMNWYRLALVTNESGGRIAITYSAEDCVANTRIPDVNALELNNLRCYPVKWTPPGYTSPIVDFFHKYVVTEVQEVDMVTTGMPAKILAYEYVGDPAWHYTDDDGLISDESKTWSGWRGYGAVRTRIGQGASQMLSEVRYFRGMYGDKSPSGTRTTMLPAVDMNRDGDTDDAVDVPAAKDEDLFAGRKRESIVYNGSLSNEVTGEAVVMWKSEPTATRTMNSTTVEARFTGVKENHTRQILDGGRAPRLTAQVTEFDDYGMPILEEHSGDQLNPGDEKCSLTSYARNLDLATGDNWIVAALKRKRDFAVGCARAVQSGLTTDEVVSDQQIYYDNATSIDTPPTRGLITKTEELEDWVGGAPDYITTATAEYDALGRKTKSSDAKGNQLTTAYFTNAAGQVNKQNEANSLGWTTSKDIEPAFGTVVRETDPNGRVTSAELDGMGRTTAIWNPGRDKGVQAPNTTYVYEVYKDRPSTITTAKLLPSGGYVSTYELFDGMMRPRQSQAPRGDGLAGALVTDTFYDKAGRAWKTYSAYLVASTPGPLLVEPNEQGQVPDRIENIFDGAGRTIMSARYVRDPSTGVPVEQSHELISYGGDRTHRTMPAGGTATTSISDTFGNAVELWRYDGPVPIGSHQVTKYEYTPKVQLAKVTDDAGNEWTNKYDVRGFLRESTDPNIGTSKMTYTRYGELETVTDPRGVVLKYTYDALARRTKLERTDVTPTEMRAQWFYDELTNSKGQQTRSVRKENGNDYVRQINGFTADYQPTGITVTVPSAETGVNGPFTTSFTYFPNGSPETVQLPDIDGTLVGMTSEVLRYQYNALGLPVGLKTSLDGGTTYVTDTGYTGYGEVATVTRQHNGGNTVTTKRTFAEGTRRVSEILVSKQTSPTDVIKVGYEYDAVGNIQRMSDVVNGDHQCFDYDGLRRLVQAWTPQNGDCAAAPSAGALGGPAKYWTTWGFDENGNRDSQVEFVTPMGERTTIYHHDTQPHRLTSATVDDDSGITTKNWDYEPGGYVKSRPNGAATQAIGWDAEGHARTIGPDTYIYDADGNRLIRRDATGKSLYLQGQELRYTTAGNTKKTTRYYTSGGEVVGMRTTGGVTWLAGDQQGTIGVTVIATSQAVAIRRQDPFGIARTGTGTWPSTMDKGFVGGTKDGTGLTHLGAREYDPVTGRFISPDPIVDYQNPAQLDCYNYGFQNPISKTDSNGKQPPENERDNFDTKYYLVDSSVSSVIVDGYKYTVQVDLYIRCNRANECNAVWYPDNSVGVPTMISRRMIQNGENGARFKIYADTTITRQRVGPNGQDLVGPAQPVEIIKNRSIDRKNTCLINLPKIEYSDNPCEYVNAGCSELDRFWGEHKDKIMGTTMVLGIGACLATAGAGCAIAGHVGLTANLGSRVLDFSMYTNAKGFVDSGDVMKMLAGMAIDTFGWKLPPFRSESGKIEWAGHLDLQLFFNTATVPATPWSDALDPFRWTYVN